MARLATNRDFYRAILGIRERYPKPARDLETYLRALMRLGCAQARAPQLTLDGLFDMLAQAFDAEPFPFAPGWLTETRPPALAINGHDGWRLCILEQIVDLREMADGGLLATPNAWFGVDAPRGSRWFNLHPHDYLEAAAVGCFGGWEPGDASGRALVPGEVAVIDERGELTSANSEDVPRPVIAIEAVAWDDFSEFLWFGQNYE